MFSVMKIGTCLRPSWTAMLRPTICGITVLARDHVRITVRSPERRTASTFFKSHSAVGKMTEEAVGEHRRLRPGTQIAAAPAAAQAAAPAPSPAGKK